MLPHSEHKYLGSILLFIDSVCSAIDTVSCFVSDLLRRLTPSERQNTKIIKKRKSEKRRESVRLVVIKELMAGSLSLAYFKELV